MSSIVVLYRELRKELTFEDFYLLNNSRSRDISGQGEGPPRAHRGGPANEEVDIQADKAISLAGKDVPTEWHNRTHRAVFT